MPVTTNPSHFFEPNPVYRYCRLLASMVRICASIFTLNDVVRTHGSDVRPDGNRMIPAIVTYFTGWFRVDYVVRPVCFRIMASGVSEIWRQIPSTRRPGLSSHTPAHVFGPTRNPNVPRRMQPNRSCFFRRVPYLLRCLSVRFHSDGVRIYIRKFIVFITDGCGCVRCATGCVRMWRCATGWFRMASFVFMVWCRKFSGRACVASLGGYIGRYPTQPFVINRCAYDMYTTTHNATHRMQSRNANANPSPRIETSNRNTNPESQTRIHNRNSELVNAIPKW